MTKIRVGIVDDERLFIQGMRMILEQDEDLTVSFEAENGLELLEKLAENENLADVVLLDLAMPLLDGVDTLLKIISLSIPIKVIILTSHYNDSMIVKLLDEGASGFLAKNEHPDIVIQTIKGVHRKGFFINDHIMQLIRDRRLLAKRKLVDIDLTHREIEILKLICKEYTNKEIADSLKISSRTVEGHRKSILEKIDCKNTAGMVIYAIEHKLYDVHISPFN
ncbi:MAG TPA: response regulator transcription factor [Saprospiraceae bacterium]|nr:response regulator transcription factor [Saprospiraceae bacterium]